MNSAPAVRSPNIQSETLARLFIAVALAALFYAVWMLNLSSAAGWTSRALRVLPRVSTFALAVVLTLMIQGRRPEVLAEPGTKINRPPFSNALLLGGALLAGLGVLLLQNWAELFEIQKYGAGAVSELRELSRRTGAWAETENGVWLHASQGHFVTGAGLLLLRFECAMFAAILLGCWAGRGARQGWHFLALILSASTCDVWLNHFKIPDLSALEHPLSALRMPFFPALPGFCLSPAITDIFFVATILEAARVLRLYPASLALGAVAGYCSAAFLALEPAPGITILAMTLMGSGIMAGAWPDLKLNSTGVGKAFLVFSLTFLLLICFTVLQLAMNPKQKCLKYPSAEM